MDNVEHNLSQADGAVRRQERETGRPATLLLVCLALLIALLRLHTFREPQERDISTYAVIAQELIAGKTLYTQTWDHKPPGVHLAYATAQLVAGYGPASIYLLNVLTACITMFGIYAAVRAESSRPRTALFAAAAWAVISSDMMLQANQPNVEVFINACAVWAFAHLAGQPGEHCRLRQIIAAGLLFAAASLFKQTAIAAAAALATAHVLFPPAGTTRRTATTHVLVIAATGMLAWCCVFGYFAAKCRFSDFWQAVFVFNRQYSGNTFTNMLAGFAPCNLFPPCMWILWPLAVFTIVCFLPSRRHSARQRAFLAAYLVATYVEVSAPGRFYPHYYQLWMPPLVIGACRALEMLDAHTRSYARAGALASGVLLASLVSMQAPNFMLSAEEWSCRKYGRVFLAADRLAPRINELLRPGESFYEWGAETTLYFSSKRGPVTRYFYNYPLLEGPQTAAATAATLQELQRNPPELYVCDKIYPASAITDWATGVYRPFATDSFSGIFTLSAKKGGRLDRALRKKLAPMQQVTDEQE